MSLKYQVSIKDNCAIFQPGIQRQERRRRQCCRVGWRRVGVTTAVAATTAAAADAATDAASQHRLMLRFSSKGLSQVLALHHVGDCLHEADNGAEGDVACRECGWGKVCVYVRKGGKGVLTESPAAAHLQSLWLRRRCSEMKCTRLVGAAAIVSKRPQPLGWLQQKQQQQQQQQQQRWWVVVAPLRALTIVLPARHSVTSTAAPCCGVATVTVRRGR